MRRTEVGIPFAAIVLAMLPAVLDQTILATGLPVVARDLGALSDVSWVVTAYVVAAAATTPLWGKLGDRYGRKLLLQLSLAVFVSASALCAAAQDITQLIVLRALQGAAAGGLMTLAMAVGRRPGRSTRARPLSGLHRGDVRGRHHRGPAGRRPAGRARELALGVPREPSGRRGRARRARGAATRPRGRSARPSLDAAGAALLAGATTAFMLTCIWGGSRYAWDSAQIVALDGGAGRSPSMIGSNTPETCSARCSATGTMMWWSGSSDEGDASASHDGHHVPRRGSWSWLAGSAPAAQLCQHPFCV